MKMVTMTRDDQPLGWDEIFEDRVLSQDSAHVFLVTAQALAAQAKVIAEVGCGRGVLADVDTPNPRGPWQDLRGEGRHVIGIDIDPVGTENPVIDEFRLIGEDLAWPLESGTVDLAVSDFVLEHVTDPPAFVKPNWPASCGRGASSWPGPSAATRCSPLRPGSCPTTPTPTCCTGSSPAARTRTSSRRPT